MKRESSIGSRVAQRKRGFGIREEAPSPKRSKSRKTLIQNYTEEDITLIKSKFGHYQHHGTGNPLAKRAPSTPPRFAITNLAAIIANGLVGQVSSDSTPKLKTERGKDGSFWTCRLRIAGSYGWTGLVLPSDTKTDNPLPINKVVWFLVESPQEKELLEKIVCETDTIKWVEVKERVITVSQLAELARRDGDAMNLLQDNDIEPDASERPA